MQCVLVRVFAACDFEFCEDPWDKVAAPLVNGMCAFLIYRSLVTLGQVISSLADQVMTSHGKMLSWADST